MTVKSVFITKNVEKLGSDKEYDYSFMDNSKYHYIAVTKPNSLLAGFLSNHGGDRFSLKYFCSFQTNKTINQHKLFCKKHDYSVMKMQEKFKMVLSKATTEMEEVGENILKHQFENRPCNNSFVLSMTIRQIL